jgi:hypothetical protein
MSALHTVENRKVEYNFRADENGIMSIRNSKNCPAVLELNIADGDGQSYMSSFYAHHAKSA